ncbi:hypothetical protein A9C19_07725 [Bacillus weihaiensis]|uniref:Spore coat protein n=1 Tax=Bacillus weihaiensis TaxID=1547283 RepID=A0A1L3MQM9_9BACI|nr:hypothetical protein A9C19_07725 [Bacillus weihaiensis]
MFVRRELILYQQQYPYFERRTRRQQTQYSPYLSYGNYQPYLDQSQGVQQNPYYFQHPYQEQQNQVFHHQPYVPFNSPTKNYMAQPFPTPYPKPTPYMKQQPSGFQTVISQFKKSDGQLDFDKMMNTAGQMMNAVNQMGGLFKGVTSMFKV